MPPLQCLELYVLTDIGYVVYGTLSFFYKQRSNRSMIELLKNLAFFTTISLEIGSIAVTLVVFFFLFLFLFLFYMNSGGRVMWSRGCHHVVRHRSY